MDYRARLKMLPECFVSHAEMEYLYDPTGKNSGVIDPNALSAGGFPFVFRIVLEQIKLENHLTESELARLRDSVRVAFPRLAKSEQLLLIEIMANTLREMGVSGNLILFSSAVIRKASILNTRYTKDYFKRLKALFASMYGVTWILPQLWKDYRLKKVKQFIAIAEAGKSVKFFNKQVVKQIYEYMEAFVAVLGEIKGPTYMTYDVEWESDMSYYIAAKLEARKIATTVLIDLHANSALYSEVPLQAICAPYGSSVYKEVYQVLVNPEESKRNGNSVFIKRGEVTIEVSYKAKKLIIGSQKEIDLNGFVVTTVESVTNEFKQYAYLWEHFDRAFFQRSNDSHRKMYLSNLLNAKSAFFTILEAQESAFGERIAHPLTMFVVKRKGDFALTAMSEKVAVKEGGWCSTGGKQVDVLDKHEVTEFVSKCMYEGIVVQSYVPSILFTHYGTPMHGHIRKASIVKRGGEVVDAGYVLKLIEQEKGNSSGYRSHMLYFDESGKFTFGKEIGGNSALYTRLEQVGLLPNVDFAKLFVEVKSEWSKAMYGVNKFVSEHDMYDFARELAESGKLSKRYILS